jgi:mannose-6-phosphate isomerase
MTAETREPTSDAPQLTVTPTVVPRVALMANPIRDYDWGSASVLAHLQGREPLGGPEAELWMGAHPSAPSALVPAAGDAVPLPDAVRAAPEDLLGAAVVEAFGPRLPFMLKVLAVAKPLSLQVHPDADRALTVHDPAGESPYVDPYPKPELIVAVDEMEALFGFRPAAEAGRLLRALGTPHAVAVADELTAAPAGGADDAAALHAAFSRLVTWPADDVPDLVAAAAAAAATGPDGAPADESTARRWVGVLTGLHPNDPLVLAPLLLGVIRLAPGEAVFVPAGVPHAYLSGCGVEVLAASDNVVRAGLTSKLVDVGELLEIIDCRPSQERLTPAVRLGDAETAWEPPVADFRLTRLTVSGEVTAAPVAGPQIVLCLRGSVSLGAGDVEVALRGGESAFVAHGAGPIRLTGDGEVYRAATGRLG